ncbi:hypothetical protein E1B28_006134 [Marasmius oreades]|uniref:C2H2-type domain-containing protein n=1 Tax=Marasmius oreades TaxID=181124 RepID=A0A9P7S5B3_9AGAR|nr:uncharacterized protein E1B28_006134 [Marasmius oreades]KAG7095377.1 hypothetical protein E1B28_006134 [Marasmius oreades]
MLPTSDTQFKTWATERQGQQGDVSHRCSVHLQGQDQRRSYPRPHSVSLVYDSSVQHELPFSQPNYHPSHLGYPESSQRTAFQIEPPPDFGAQPNVPVVGDVDSESPPSLPYPTSQHGYTPRFMSPDATVETQDMTVDGTGSMWPSHSGTSAYPAPLPQGVVVHHSEAIQFDRSSSRTGTEASVKWQHQPSNTCYDVLYVQHALADASPREASIPMREETSFIVQTLSGVTDRPLTYPHGQIPRTLSATALEHALDECDPGSEFDNQSHSYQDIPQHDTGSTVEHTVGIVKKKKKSKMHKCDICDKLFPRPSGLKTHMNTHNNVKPFACEYPGCNRSFTVRSNARRHLRTHGVIPDPATPSGPDYVVNFDTPVIPESQGHQFQTVPQKIKWMPPSLSPFNNVASLRSVSENEDSESDFDELEDDSVIQQGVERLTMPLTSVSPFQAGEASGHYGEERDSYSEVGAYPYHPSQFRILPGPSPLPRNLVAVV